MKKRRLKSTTKQYLSIVDDLTEFVLGTVDRLASIEELIKLSENDDNLRLLLADIRFITMEPKLEKYSYEFAATTGYPEALTMLANEYYLRIVHKTTFDYGIRPPILQSDIKSRDKFVFLSQMWSLIEEIIEKKWVCKFLIEQGSDALKHGTWIVSKQLKRIIIEVNIDASAELNAIEKAYAGIYDPALDTAMQKVRDKQAADNAAATGGVRL